MKKNSPPQEIKRREFLRTGASFAASAWLIPLGLTSFSGMVHTGPKSEDGLGSRPSESGKMKRKGINYDVGIEFSEAYLSRPEFNTDIVFRELEIIKNDLHCNAVRISGTDPNRLRIASEKALELGFEVWLSPHLHDKNEQETNDYTVQCAEMAEELRQKWNKLVFITGCELMIFMNGILDGNNVLERLGNLRYMDGSKFMTANSKLNAFLKGACENVRKVFKGPITYASVPLLENVDWNLFDFVSLDFYRDKQNRDSYGKTLSTYFKHNKPVIITEFGCCAYRGGEDAGGSGFMIMDQAHPGQLNGNYIRDEAMQAREITELLAIHESCGVEGTFVFTFVTPALCFNENALNDMDMAGYGIVKSYSAKRGTTYPDMHWEPKEAFYALAETYKS